MNAKHLSVACAVVLGMATPVLAADTMLPAGSKTFPISAQNGSGETGTVVLSPALGGAATSVTIALKGAPDVAQPAHIHMGSCAKLDPKPTYPLKSVTDGKSTTTVQVSMDKLSAGSFAVNIHKSADDLATYVACGDISGKKGDAMMMPMSSPSP
jgi:hypothetical protein